MCPPTNAEEHQRQVRACRNNIAHSIMFFKTVAEILQGSPPLFCWDSYGPNTWSELPLILQQLPHRSQTRPRSCWRRRLSDPRCTPGR